MRLTLKRMPKSTDAILGTLTIDGKFECFTLEGLAVSIPLGVYPVDVTYSPRFGRELPLLLHVPGRTSIRIHPGNTSLDTEGCILVGKTHTDNSVGNSRHAFSDLLVKIQDARARRETVEVSVESEAS